VCAVGLLSPALVLSPRWLQWIAPVLPLLLSLPGVRHYAIDKTSDIADARARADSPSYRQLPVRAVGQVLLLQAAVRRILPRVKQPVVVIHSRQDHTCPLTNVEILTRSLSGPVHPVILDDSYHVLSVDVDKERAGRELALFVEKTVSVGAACHAR